MQSSSKEQVQDSAHGNLKGLNKLLLYRIKSQSKSSSFQDLKCMNTRTLNRSIYNNRAKINTG